jgi:hypothetical protein
MPFVQVGFMPSPNFELPDLPNHSARPAESVKVAASMGCNIRYTGSNEILISHPALPWRRPVVHSAHRNDTSRALVTFLNQVKDALMQARRTAAAVATAAGNGTMIQPILTPRFAPPALVEPKIPEPKLELKIEQTKPEKPKVPERLTITDIGSRVRRHLLAIFEQRHYQKCCTGDEIRSFQDCNTMLCVRAREAVDAVDAVAHENESLLEQLKTATNSEHETLESAMKLQDDLDAAKRRIAELESTTTKPAPAQTPAEITQQREGSVMVNGRILFPENVWILPGDDASTRSDKYELLLNLFHAALEKVWTEAQAPLTRVIEAIRICIQKSGYDPKWQVGFKVLNFMRFRNEIVEARRPGAGQFLVAAKGWTYFRTACDKLREQN